MKATDPVATFLAAAVLWSAFLGWFTASLVQEGRAVYAFGRVAEIESRFGATTYGVNFDFDGERRAGELKEEAEGLAVQGGYFFAGCIVAGFLLVTRRIRKRNQSGAEGEEAQ